MSELRGRSGYEKQPVHAGGCSRADLLRWNPCGFTVAGGEVAVMPIRVERNSFRWKNVAFQTQHVVFARLTCQVLWYRIGAVERL